DPDAAAVPADLRALSTSTGWVPVAVSMVRWEDGSGDDAADDRHYATEAAAFHTVDPAVLYLWIIEHGSPFAAGEPGSIDEAVPWGDGRHAGLSWVEGADRYLFQASALDDRLEAPTGSALKEAARSMTPGPNGWDLPGAELVARDHNDGPESGTDGEAGYAQITWAPRTGGKLDTSRIVSQTTRRGDLTDMISELHEASSLGQVRLVRARDGTMRFVIDEGELGRYALASVGSTVVNWQGPGGPALDQLVTETEILDGTDWDRAWIDAAGVVGAWVAESGDTTPAVRLAPDSSWKPISALDPSLWSPMERFESRTQGASVPRARRWIGAFQAAGSTSALPEVVVSVETSDSRAPLYICEGSWVATTLGSDACASRDPGAAPGPGSSFLVSGNRWYISLSSPNMGLGDLSAFSNGLEPRGDVVNGFDHADPAYRLTFESDEPAHWGEMVTSTWVRDDLELWLRIWTTDHGSVIERIGNMAAAGFLTPLEDDRYLIRWPEETRITWYDEAGNYEATVGWTSPVRGGPPSEANMVEAAIELIEGLTEIDRDEWRSLIESVNEPYVDPYSASLELSEEEFRGEFMSDSGEE
ncbi:MAG: hypothetical protein OES24_21720, partial [Acidimicrobiia bacterium]|nr:hypothetical protein [Acidimicrobiia bacterium]